MKASAETTVREALRIRPKFVEVLDSYTGHEYWHHLDLTLSNFCKLLALDAETLLTRLSTLPHEPPQRIWTDIPLYHLVDRLAMEHLEFREKDIPEIERLLFTADPSVFPEDYPVKAIQNEFHSFKIDFFLHMEEEEGFLFPMVLRTEASVSHPDLALEIFKGSVSEYPTSMLHTPELKLRVMLSDLRIRMEWQDASGKGFPLLEEIAFKMEDFELRLGNHADLETEILLPRTKAMEGRLRLQSMEAVKLEGEL